MGHRPQAANSVRNGGKWTEARYKGFITSLLRSGSRRWPPKYETLNEAKTKKKINKTTGRLAQHYRCNSCEKEFPLKSIQVDHIEPIIDPKVGFTSWDDFIHRLFCEKENLQTLCVKCHKAKSLKERNAHQKRTRTRG